MGQSNEWQPMAHWHTTSSPQPSVHLPIPSRSTNDSLYRTLWVFHSAVNSPEHPRSLRSRPPRVIVHTLVTVWSSPPRVITARVRVPPLSMRYYHGYPTHAPALRPQQLEYLFDQQRCSILCRAYFLFTGYSYTLSAAWSIIVFGGMKARLDAKVFFYFPSEQFFEGLIKDNEFWYPSDDDTGDVNAKFL